MVQDIRRQVLLNWLLMGMGGNWHTKHTKTMWKLNNCNEPDENWTFCNGEFAYRVYIVQRDSFAKT